VCHNFLTLLPPELSCLVCLAELDVSLNTDMRELPRGLGQLQALTRLTASHMRLKQLPRHVCLSLSLSHTHTHTLMLDTTPVSLRLTQQLSHS
jgi:hypothetical protein